MEKTPIAKMHWPVTPIANFCMGAGVKTLIFVFFGPHLGLAFWARGTNRRFVVCERKLEPGRVRTLFLPRGCRTDHLAGQGYVICLPLFFRRIEGCGLLIGPQEHCV